MRYDEDIVEAFTEEHEDEFNEWLLEIEQGKKTEYELKVQYCESRPSMFDNFSYNWLEDQEAEAADKFNDGEKSK